MPVEVLQIVDASAVPKIKAEMAQLRGDYTRQKRILKSLPAGRARGMAGYHLSQIGKQGLKLKADLVKVERACLLRGVVV
jgi:hypothetical protein